MMVARICLSILIGLTLLLEQGVVTAGVADLSVTDRQLVSKQRATRTDFDYTYTITVENSGAPLSGVVVSVSSRSGNTLIQEAEVVLGDVASGSNQSSDTFTIRQNRRVAFDPADLSYSFSADDPDLPPASYLTCSLDPRHLQLPAADTPTDGASVADFDPTAAGFIGQVLDLDLLQSGWAEAFFTDLDGNGIGDLLLRSPGSSTLQVWLGDADGRFTVADDYSIGTAPLTALVAGEFIGGPLPDIAVASSDGSIHFLEGTGGGAFVPRAGQRIALGTPIIRLTSADLDGDGDDDLLLSTASGAVVLLQDDDRINSDLINNGDFSRGLSAWQVEVVGHDAGQQAGSVEVVDGHPLLREHESFRTTLQQPYIVPDPPGTLAFDLLSVMLDDPQDGVPDAFEVSLLDAASNPVVPTIEAAATAFLNINPGGVRSLASGVSVTGDRVTLDLSAVTPGTAVTLYFDLIGNPPGRGSQVSIDNVDGGAVVTQVDSFSGNDLPGPFAAPAGVGSCDLDGDSLADAVIHDAGSGELLIYSLDTGGGFTRIQTISLGGN